MTNNLAYKCLSCAQSYDSADHDLRCRVSTNGLLCSPDLAEDCRKYIYEPGTDAEEEQYAEEQTLEYFNRYIAGDR